MERTWNFYEEVNNPKMLFRVGLHFVLLNLQLQRFEPALEMSQKMLNVDEELAGELNVLIKAFEMGDQKLVSKITMGQNFVYTENEFAKLGANLKVSKSAEEIFVRNGSRSLDSGFASGSTGMSREVEFDEDDLS